MQWTLKAPHRLIRLKSKSLMPKGITKLLRKQQQHQHENLSGGVASSDRASAHVRVLKNEGANNALRKEFCQKIRILVLGRSGAGKSTLIRLMVGKDGPHSVSEGVAGVQNINDEFFLFPNEQGVPLVIHDSNGMDVKGKERVDEIKDFLDGRQTGDNYTEHIHIVWYVISAIDPRCVDDGDVMKMISDYKLPLLLIMTHNDHDKVKVTDAVVDMLLQRVYKEEDEREAVKKLMVRVSNDGVSTGSNNELVIDDSKHDVEGLMLVARRTQQIMDEQWKYTSIPAQVADKEGKHNRG